MRNGNVTGHLTKTDHDVYTFIDSASGITYMENGIWSQHRQCTRDIVSEYVEKTDAQKLSDSLLAACKAAGIEKLVKVVQQMIGSVWHVDRPPTINTFHNLWQSVGGVGFTKLNHPPYADDWRESLMEWHNESKQKTQLEGIVSGHGSSQLLIQCEEKPVVAIGQKVTVILQPTNETK